MIDPTNITNYNLTDHELEEHILFWVAAAGKTGVVAAHRLEIFLTMITYNNISPFEAIRKTIETHPTPLGMMLRTAGMGCHSHKSRTFTELAYSNLNLRTCSADDLEKIYGIGRKTSRCFILHSRKDTQYAGIDTHMLKNLRAAGVENVPKQTPSTDKQYKRLEKEVLRLAKVVGMSPASYDLMVWNKYSAKSMVTS